MNMCMIWKYLLFLFQVFAISVVKKIFQTFKYKQIIDNNDEQNWMDGCIYIAISVWEAAELLTLRNTKFF